MYQTTMIGQTLSSLPIDLNYVNYLKIENGIYDDMYATHINESLKSSGDFCVPEEWDEETYIHAKFSGNLYAGNTDFGIDKVTHIVIKRREIGEHKWMPLMVKEINSVNDFTFTETDKYAISNTDYEYAVVPIIDGEEWNYSISEPCEVSFDCLVVLDKDEGYSTLYDIDISATKNNTSSTITSWGKKYPIYVANAFNDYYTGDVTATFINMDCNNMNPSVKEVTKFRNKLMDFLNNRKIKYIKDPLGRCWIACIGTSITDEDGGHPIAHKVSFNFTEIGDVNSNSDMYKYGFLNIGREWWI